MYLRDIFKFKFQSTNSYEIKRLGKILILLKIYEMKGKKTFVRRYGYYKKRMDFMLNYFY